MTQVFADEEDDFGRADAEMPARAEARRRSPLRSLLTALALIVAAGFVFFGLQRWTGAEVAAGAPAPAFEFTTYDGQTVRLADLRGKGVVLNFWASWCGPCRLETPWLAAAAAREADRNVVFVGLTHRDDAAAAQRFMAEQGMTYANGPDVGDQWMDAYAVNGIPATFFIDAEGVLRDQQRGMFPSPEDLVRGIDTIRPAQ